PEGRQLRSLTLPARLAGCKRSSTDSQVRATVTAAPSGGGRPAGAGSLGRLLPGRLPGLRLGRRGLGRGGLGRPALGLGRLGGRLLGLLGGGLLLALGEDAVPPVGEVLGLGKADTNDAHECSSRNSVRRCPRARLTAPPQAPGRGTLPTALRAAPS